MLITFCKPFFRALYVLFLTGSAREPSRWPATYSALNESPLPSPLPSFLRPWPAMHCANFLLISPVTQVGRSVARSLCRGGPRPTSLGRVCASRRRRRRRSLKEYSRRPLSLSLRFGPHYSSHLGPQLDSPLSISIRRRRGRLVGRLVVRPSKQ